MNIRRRYKKYTRVGDFDPPTHQPTINSKRVMATVPNYLKGPPPVVSYTYTRTIAGKIFNNRRVVEELDMDAGTAGMDCTCSSANYKYEPCGHVETSDLSIIKDVKLRNLINKGPTYREPNNIDWIVKVNVAVNKELFLELTSGHVTIVTRVRYLSAPYRHSTCVG